MYRSEDILGSYFQKKTSIKLLKIIASSASSSTIFLFLPQFFVEVTISTITRILESNIILILTQDQQREVVRTNRNILPDEVPRDSGRSNTSARPPYIEQFTFVQFSSKTDKDIRKQINIFQQKLKYIARQSPDGVRSLQYFGKTSIVHILCDSHLSNSLQNRQRYSEEDTKMTSMTGQVSVVGSQ